MLCVVLACLGSSPGCGGKSELGTDQLLQRAKQARAKRDYTQAARDLRSAEKQEPNSARIRYEMGLLYSEVGDVNMAEFQFQEALRLDPSYREAQRQLTLITERRAGAPRTASPEEGRHTPLLWTQSDAEAMAALNRGLLRIGENRAAEQNIRDVLILFPRELAGEVSAASSKLEQHDLRGVEQALRSATARDPKSMPAHWALGRVCSMRGTLKDAEVEFSDALRLDPQAAAVLDDLAQVQWRQGQAAEAEKSYRRLAAMGARAHADAYAAFLFEEGRTDEAIAEYRRLADREPSDRIARTRLIAAYLAAKRFREAEEPVNAALTKNQKDTDALLQRAEIYLIGGKYEKAENDLNLIFGFRPDWAEVHYVLGRVFQALGAPWNVRREMSNAVRLDPSLVAARVDLAGALILANDAQAALDVMEGAPEAGRDTWPAVIQKNWALIALGRLEEAKAHLGTALSAQTMPELLLQRGLIKMRDKDLQGGREDLLRVLQLNPQEWRAKEALASISTDKGGSLTPAKVAGSGRAVKLPAAVQ